MSKRSKALIYNFLSFIASFLPLLVIIQSFTGLLGIWIPITAGVAATLLAPKFQAVKTHEGEKLYMRWLFLKGVKEIE